MDVRVLIFVISMCLVPGRAPAQTMLASDPAGVSCVLAAETVVPASTALFDAAEAGQVIATFTGTSVPLRVGGLQAVPAGGRVRVATSSGKEGFRLQGYMPAGAIETFAGRDLPVAGSHVAITASQRVKIVEATSQLLTVEFPIPGADAQRARAKVPCDAVALVPPTVETTPAPERARKYQMRDDTLDLYDRPRGDVVFGFRMEEDARQVFWSTEAERGFVHIRSRGALTIDGWARARDLVPLRRSEYIMQRVPRVWPRRPRQVAMKDAPPLVTALADIPVHRRPDDEAQQIGVVEAGARVYPMERSAGWVNVYPEALAVMPPEGGGFWVRVKDLEPGQKR